MRTLLFSTSLAVLVGMLWASPSANAADLSTFGDESTGDAYQGRIARYTTFVGTKYGSTFVTNVSQGLYDYMSYPRSTQPTHALNDGNTANATNTFAYDDDVYEDRYERYFSGENGFPYDFYGYKFKMGVTVDSLVLTQRAYGDGGVFTSKPDVEVMDAVGNWTTAAVTWDVPYDNTLDQYTTYNIGFDQPEKVWGIRVIGDALDGAGSPDDNGWVGVGELQVNGTNDIVDRIDLTTNLALNQTPIWTTTGTGTPTQKAQPEILTDGNCTVRSSSYLYDTTWGVTSPGEEFAGALFEESQINVAAAGIVMMMFSDGGYITADTLRIEYLEDDGDWTDPNDWHTVSGLDLGTYDDNYTALQGAPAGMGRYAHSELLTFDTITDPIDGLRIIGTTAHDGTEADPDGFLGMLEFEAFAAVPEPSTITLLLGAFVAMYPILRRKKS